MAMARRLTLESDGSIYHVLNRGNYRAVAADRCATTSTRVNFRTRQPPLDDLDDAVGVDPDGLFFAKKHDEPVVPRRTDVLRILKLILRAIRESHDKRAKRLTLRELLDCLHSHDMKLGADFRAASGKARTHP